MMDSPTPEASSRPVPKLQLPPSCNPPTSSNAAKQKVWVIFGASGHMGRSCLKTVLNHGDIVTAVGQSHQDTPESITSLATSLYSSASADSSVSEQAPTTSKEPPQTILGLVCDVRVPASVSAAVKAAISHWGRIDIILNCSGYGLMGASEDQDEYDIRNQFETNFFGMLNIIDASLTYFRTRPNGAGGRYLIFSSAGAALGTPGMGPYCATKFAVEGLVESMLYEVDTFNIKATLVGLGPARRDEVETPETQRVTAFSHFQIKALSEPYQTPTNPAGHTKKVMQWIDTKQSVSTVKTAELVWQLGHCQFPPLRLFLGMYAVEVVRDSLRTVIEEMEDWKHLNFGAEDTGKKDEMRQGKGKNVIKQEEEDDNDFEDEEEQQDEDRSDNEDSHMNEND